MPRQMIVVLLAVLVMLLGIPAPACGAEPQPQCYALLVGCTAYPSLEKQYHLVGPGNDVPLFRSLLEDKLDFPSENIVVLSEAADGEAGRPTRANIHREFDRLAERARPGDQVVILMGGHGSQQPDNDPENPADPEYDGLDEIFLPADIGGWDHAAGKVTNAISDDELRHWIGRIRDRQAFVWIIIDACHSGTMVRGNDTEVVRQVPVAELVPATARREAQRHAVAPEGPTTRGAPPASQEPFEIQQETSEGLVAIYAAQSTEPTVELPLPRDALPRSQKVYGLLSYTLNKVLSRSTSPLTYTELVQRVHQQYAAWGRHYPTPLIEGTNRDRLVLGVEEFPQRSRIVLKTQADGSLAVNAGSLSGLTVGTVLAFYPPAGEADSRQLLGHGRVIDVRVLESIIQPCEFAGVPTPQQLPAGARAEVAYREYGLRALRVAVDRGDASPASRTRVTKALQEAADEQASLVALVDDVRNADWLIRTEGDAAFLVPASGWSQVRREGEPSKRTPQPALFQPVNVDDDFGAWVGSRLRRIARVENLLNLATPMSGSRLLADGVSVKLEMLRFADRSDRKGELIDFSHGAVLQAGDIVGFRVTNLGRSAVDVTLLFVDSGYGIESFFPRAGTVTDNRLAPRASFLSPRAKITPDTVGLERMVVVAVQGKGPPTDFGWLEQPTIEQARSTKAYRGAGAASSSLTRLFEQAAFASGSTRGLSMEDEENHCIRVISWRSRNDDGSY